MTERDDNFSHEMPKGLPYGRAGRFTLSTVGGAIPFLGGILSAAAGSWSEQDQDKVNSFFQQWLKMLEDELAEKARTILEITSRLDMNDEATAERITSPQYQSLLRKAFRDWAGAESEQKRKLITNILAHAADVTLTSDDVVRLFLQWIDVYSELHFSVIAAVYNDAGITRARIWGKIGKAEVREDSAEADLFKLLLRDLSTGGIVRQHREKDYAGNFLRRSPQKQHRAAPISTTMESAFEDTKGYELTELGQQFVHYAMTDIPVKIEFKWDPEGTDPT